MKINLLFILYFIIYSSYSQDKIEWIELDNNVEYTNNGKKIIIDLYTDWCGWCKVMDKNTFTDSEVVSLINKNFSTVKFNAEYQGNINFNDSGPFWGPEIQ